LNVCQSFFIAVLGYDPNRSMAGRGAQRTHVSGGREGVRVSGCFVRKKRKYTGGEGSGNQRGWRNGFRHPPA
jgi:hypothetical protein